MAWTAVPQRGLVIVLRPQEVDEMTRIALARVTGELSAARFRVNVLPLDPNQDPSVQVESIAPEANPVAVFAIAHITDADGDTIAIWVCDRVGRRTTIQRMAMRGDNIRQDAEVLALEAIELIRVSIGGLWPAPRAAVTAPSRAAVPSASSSAPPLSSGSTTPPPPPAPATAKPTPTAAPTTAADASTEAPLPTQPAPPDAVEPLPWTAGRRPELTLGLGIAALRDGSAPSTQWVGALAAVARWPDGFAARASFAGFGSSVTLSGVGGTAVLHDQIAMLGAGWYLPAEGPAALYASLALGAAHVQVSGTATDPARSGHADGSWAPIGAAGLGTQVRLGRRISVGAGIDLVWAWSQLFVRVGESLTSASLRPGALISFSLQASF